MADNEYIRGLEFLAECTNEQLDKLVEIMRTKGELSIVYLHPNSLDERVAKNWPNHRKYIDVIWTELLDFGSNTLGSRRTYRRILTDVCDKVDAPYNSSQSIEEIESSLLAKMFDKMWEKLSENDRRAILDRLDIQSKDKILSKVSYTAIAKLFQAGGFASYQLSVIVANAVSRTILGTGLSFATNAGLTKALSVFTNPVITALMGAWTIWQIAGPAYRVTVPAVTYIASLRRIHNNS